MRLLDPKNPSWARRYICVVTAMVGVSVFAVGWPVTTYLEVINQDLLNECFSQTGSECAKFMYYHMGGDATVVEFFVFVLGGNLLAFSGLVALGRLIDRRRAKLRESNVA
jgi:hypothetical protein